LSYPLADLDVTYAPSIARWKARVRLPIRHNWTFFASSYCWDVTGGNLSTWAIFKGVGHFDRPLKVEGDVAHQRN